MSLEHPHGDRPHSSSFWKSKIGLATIGFLVVALFFLLTEHRAHVFGVVPWLLILACPLLHLFMHRRHGNGDRHGHDNKEPDRGANS